MKYYNDIFVRLQNISACVKKYRHDVSGVIARKHQS
jgi:hypothetical protein